MHGSNGIVIVTQDWAGLWTDSRYYEEAEDALAGSDIELIRMNDIGVLSIGEWLKKNLTEGQTVGFNGANTDLRQARDWVKQFQQARLKTNTELDLIDRIWNNRPIAPLGELFIVDDEYAGKSIKNNVALTSKIALHPIATPSLPKTQSLFM